MSLAKLAFFAALALPALLGCGEAKTEIPTGEFTEEQKKAIREEDARVANEESRGTKKP